MGMHQRSWVYDRYLNRVYHLGRIHRYLDAACLGHAYIHRCSRVFHHCRYQRLVSCSHRFHVDFCVGMSVVQALALEYMYSLQDTVVSGVTYIDINFTLTTITSTVDSSFLYVLNAIETFSEVL